MDDKTRYEELCTQVRETALLQSTAALLEWDQQTGLPAKADEYRCQQMTFLAGEIHRRNTDPKLGEALEQLSDSELVADPESDAATVVRNLKREFDRNVRVPADLVKELAKATSAGHNIWVKARKEDDFASFAPTLQNIIALSQQKADAIGFEDCRYDALLDEYEPGAKTAEVDQVLGGLRDALVPLIDQLKGSETQPSGKMLHRSYPINAQKEFAREASEKIGFDYSRGRLDETHHPFCTEIGPHDCRILTRYDESFFSAGFFGTLHEAGHGMYEQGLRSDQHGLPTGRYCSLGIHESQSRLWENLVGRSYAFWKHFYPVAQQRFPQSLGDQSLDDFFAAINVVEPSLIRVEADEATYNLHIIIRFELERDLIDGTLAVDDLADAWNAKYESSLGIIPPSFADGVLQDVHWSAGLFGYFPTYSLGNLYASQFFAAAQAECGDLAKPFANGEFSELKKWLNERVHHHGQSYSSPELAKKVTGQALSHDALITDLRNKLLPVYGL
ncbi:carboxypeptidase M32 [Mariniblastus fucicola]|uniref:Metal-dependent carboxypeptidase n=1 Tax=Mariniblastus fucicola TaxID=980251 RepID=A0A5B9P8Z5_9BACT|nr:carboxypeptidase M32 [Mariniblastus fucicola]QEG22834.1 Thermostable carboxypeptidase 1 [Mariniblastus fucicola]